MTHPSEPVQTPITGREDQGGRDRPAEALAQFYAAFNGRDLALVEAVWETSAEAVMDNPVGGISRGWPEIRAVYERLFAGPIRVTVEFWDYTIVEEARVFAAIGRERGQLIPQDAGPLDVAFRTTRLFRRDAQGAWRLLHHHGSIEDPRLLQAYQDAVHGAR